MITAKSIECAIQAVGDSVTANATCATGASSGPSAWELASVIANWGLFLVAVAALMVSYFSTRHAQKNSDDALKQNYKSTQAQLDVAREAIRSDLAERKNSRELDMTAEFISALDDLMFSNLRKVGEEGREEGLYSATSRALNAAGRYQMFVGNPKTLIELQEEFLRILEDFKPTSVHDLESAQYHRIHNIHAFLRTLVMEYQRDRKVRTLFVHLSVILKQRRLSGSWEELDAFFENLQTS